MQTLRSTTFVICFSVALLAALTCGVVNAQVLYGSLTGNVTDPINAAVPGAKVEALNVGRLRPREAGRLVSGRDRHPGNRVALLVEHAAAERARGLLRQRRHAGEQQEQRCRRQMPPHSDASGM